MQTARPAGATQRSPSGGGRPEVGVRVVLRRRLSGGGLGDVLGHVERWSDGEVVVRTRTGRVSVREADLVAAKRVPEPPARRRARTSEPGDEVGPAEQA